MTATRLVKVGQSASVKDTTTPQTLVPTGRFSIGKEPHQSAPKLIRPVVVAAVSLIFLICAVAAYGVWANPGATYPYFLLGLNAVGAWSAVLAFLGRESKLSFSVFGKKSE